MSVNPANTVTVNYKQIGGIASAGAKAHAASRQKFESEETKAVQDAPPPKDMPPRIDIKA
jgi:hypothetical protein